MYAMQDQEAGSDERSAEAPGATASDRLGSASRGVLIRDSRAGILAWSEQFQQYNEDQRGLISIPQLNLGHTLTLRLVARRPYHSAMAGCTVEVPSEGLCVPFHVIRATFPFYRTGEASMTGVLLALDNGRPLPLLEVVELLKVPVPKG